MPSHGQEALRLGDDQKSLHRMVYFRRWLSAPRLMGSLVPASVGLCQKIAAAVARRPGEYVVETGGGTGAVTRALLDYGIPAGRLVVVEIDPVLTEVLRRGFPEVTVIEGDACHLPDLVPSSVLGRVGTVISGIPMVLQSQDIQARMVDAIFALMPPGRRFLHYSYCPTSPLSCRRLRLRAERVGFTLGNLPPASVWGYSRAANA